MRLPMIGLVLLLIHGETTRAQGQSVIIIGGGSFVRGGVWGHRFAGRVGVRAFVARSYGWRTFSPYFCINPVVIDSPPLVVVPQFVRFPVEAPQREQVPILGNFDPDQFLVIRPRKRVPALRPKPPAERRDEPRPFDLQPPAGPKAMVPRDFGQQQRRLPDPDAEADRQLDLGIVAFRDGQYGLAAQRWQRASELDPNDPLPRRLVVQAWFASGNYDQAVRILAMLLRKSPRQRLQDLQPRELYPRPGRFEQHLTELQSIVEEQPDNPTYWFLLGYEYYLDGQIDRARGAMEAARARAVDPTLADDFLRRLGERIVRR